MVIKITGNWGQITLFNVYNDCTHDRTIHALTKFHRDNSRIIQGREAKVSTHHIIQLGDFNRHHLAWDNLDDHRLFTREAVEVAETLIKVIADHGLEMALAPGTPTHVHNVTKKWTRLDQVFVTKHTMDRILICKTRTHQRGLNTDHIPIVMRIDASLGRTESAKTKNFRDVDWKEFCSTLEKQLLGFGIPRRLRSLKEVNRECDRLTKAIQNTRAQVVPTTTICPHSKR